jgi:hypothetical protein
LTAATPPVLHTAVPNWNAGDTLHVIEVRPGSHEDDNPVLVVEHV